MFSHSAKCLARHGAAQSDPIDARDRAMAATDGTPTLSTVVVLFKRRTVPVWQPPNAACIASVAGLTAGQLMQFTSGGITTIPDDPALTATFENGDRLPCREFEVDQPEGETTVAVACRSETAADAPGM